MEEQDEKFFKFLLHVSLRVYLKLESEENNKKLMNNRIEFTIILDSIYSCVELKLESIVLCD